jgi:hypothetical protein
LTVALQKITDKISLSGGHKIKRSKRKSSINTEKLRFNNNPEALIFRSFHQGKEQRIYFNE